MDKIRFYEISAQVIPTLLIAVAIEARLIFGRGSEPEGWGSRVERWFQRLMFVAAAGAEIIALYVIGQLLQPALWMKWTVLGAIQWELAIIVAMAFAASDRRRIAPSP
jgi:hypothetical protein